MNILNERQLQVHVPIVAWLLMIANGLLAVVFLLIMALTLGGPAHLLMGALAFPALMFALAIPGLIAGFGLRAHKPWARMLGVAGAVLDVAGFVYAYTPFVVETPTRYDQNNTIELQLPFIKHYFPEAKILPLGVPPALGSLRIGERAVEISRELGRQTLVLGSTDLTHYGHNYGYAPKGVGKAAVDWVRNENDKRLVDRILRMEAEEVIRESLTNHNACCSGAVATAIVAAKKLGARQAQKLFYATSYDVRPDNSFVGYVGVLFLSRGESRSD